MTTATRNEPLVGAGSFGTSWSAAATEQTLSGAPFVIANQVANVLEFAKGRRIPDRPGCALQRDLTATVIYEGASVLVSNAETGEEGYGRTLDEAQRDFLTSLCDHMESLSRREGRLSTRDLTLLKTLRSLLLPNP